MEERIKCLIKDFCKSEVINIRIHKVSVLENMELVVRCDIEVYNGHNNVRELHCYDITYTIGARYSEVFKKDYAYIRYPFYHANSMYKIEGKMHRAYSTAVEPPKMTSKIAFTQHYYEIANDIICYYIDKRTL